MSTNGFRSSLAENMDRFVDIKCCGGINRKRLVDKLSFFDRFVADNEYRCRRIGSSLTTAYIEELARVGAGTRYNRFCVCRQFCEFLAQEDPDSYVPDSIPSGRNGAVRQAHIYSGEEIAAVMREALALSPQRPLRGKTYCTLIGLLSATGMRIHEGIGLNLEDFHRDEGLLYVREGKFSKSRWVPLSPSARQALGRYTERRTLSPPRDPDSPLLLNLWGKRLNYRTVYGTFRQLLVQAGLHSGKGPGPRIHDFRHTFAVRCLLRWYRNGEDLNARLPWLATYMGHVEIANTMVYLHATAELLEEVSSRFEKHYRTTIHPLND